MKHKLKAVNLPKTSEIAYGNAPFCHASFASGALYVIRLRNSFLYPYLTRELPRLMSLRTGAQQPHINKGVVDESLIVIPQENTIKRYYKAVESVFEKINIKAIENKKLVELRDWLLPMLMNGQVTVKDS